MANDDLISRAAAIESLGECPYNWNDWPEEIQAVDDWESHKKALEDLPAVDAAPVVHARWIDYKDEHQCSACKEITGVDAYVWKHLRYDFCPYCGAKMDGDTDE